MKNEFPAACCSVDVFREAFKPDVSAVQFSDPLDEVFEGSAKPIKPPDDQGIPCPDIVDGFGQSFPL
jgi:hypothetical protein